MIIMMMIKTFFRKSLSESEPGRRVRVSDRSRVDDVSKDIQIVISTILKFSFCIIKNQQHLQIVISIILKSTQSSPIIFTADLSLSYIALLVSL